MACEAEANEAHETGGGHVHCSVRMGVASGAVACLETMLEIGIGVCERMVSNDLDLTQNPNM